MPLGRYSRIKSLVGRYQGLRGSAKKTWIFSRFAKVSCRVLQAAGDLPSLVIGQGLADTRQDGTEALGEGFQDGLRRGSRIFASK